MHNRHVDSLDKNCWCDVVDYSSLLDDVVPAVDYFGNAQLRTENVGVEIDLSIGGAKSEASDCSKPRKRGRSDSFGETGKKACREKLRREKLNERFTELCAVLEPGRPVKTDKSAILGDAIRALNQLKAESRDCKETNKKLLEEIKTLKAEKNELREEKMMLKATKERIENQFKTMAIPTTNFMPPHPPVYPAGSDKMAVFGSYSLVPMWQYLPQSAYDTSMDQALRPPAA